MFCFGFGHFAEIDFTCRSGRLFPLKSSRGDFIPTRCAVRAPLQRQNSRCKESHFAHGPAHKKTWCLPFRAHSTMVIIICAAKEYAASKGTAQKCRRPKKTWPYSHAFSASSTNTRIQVYPAFCCPLSMNHWNMLSTCSDRSTDRFPSLSRQTPVS